MALLHLAIPTPTNEPFHLAGGLLRTQFKESLQNAHLQRLNAGIFFQHLILTATFFAIPMILQQQAKQGHLTEQWHFYLPLMVGAFLAMLPFIVLAERKHRVKSVFVGAVIVTGLSQWILAYTYAHWIFIVTMMFIYFVAFNVLEANLPSLVSRQAPPSSKGTAMGIYSSSQFLGIFAGGALSGVIYQWAGFQGIFVINGCISLIWLGMALYMKPDQYQLTVIIPVTEVNDNASNQIAALRALTGVHDAVYSSTEHCIYLRVDKVTYRQGSAENILT